VTAPIGCPANRNGNTRRVRGRRRGSGGVTVTRVQTTMPGTRAIPAVKLTRWYRSQRTTSVFTTSWAMSGNGQRIVMPTPTPMHRRMGAQAKQERLASALIGAAHGSTPRGSCAQPPARGTRPTTATSSWGSAWRGRSLEAGACVLTLFFFLDEFQERLSFSASAGFRFKQIEERRFNETNMAHLAV